MKIVIGVDPEGRYLEAVHLLERLKFTDSKLILATAAEPLPIPAIAGGIMPPIEQNEAAEQAAIQDRLYEAQKVVKGIELVESVRERRLTGPTASEIIELAQEEKADLVAIGSHRHGPIGSVFLGSVGRALAIGARASFLIGRSGTAGTGNVRALFATDHSDYADRCLDELLRLDPVGLTDLTIVFATDGEFQDLCRAAGEHDGVDRSPDELLDDIRAKGAALVRKCNEAGRHADYRIAEGFPIDALHEQMHAHRADLLILGARGHGWIERLLIGSLALHEVVAEPFSLLVIRLPEEPQ